VVNLNDTAVRDGVELEVWNALTGVYDPEIPPLAITDLGIVERVVVTADRVDVTLLPTFAGCPALDVIREDVTAAVGRVSGGRGVEVRFVYSPPWTSDRITPAGRDSLKRYGLTPPGVGGARVVVQLAGFKPRGGLASEGPGAECPFCGSTETELESAFGPTLCRSTHFCSSCRNPFEAFKPKSR
jgi:ring-1,2-phenylacetyl-CoA epoxidase subunit PaaD